MKRLVPFVVAGALLLSGLAVSQSTQDPQADLASRVSALEQELSAERDAHRETRALLDETVSYLQSQSKQASGLMKSLDASEEAGFTAGINYRSREILLGGLRSYLGASQKGLPGAKKTEEEKGARN